MSDGYWRYAAESRHAPSSIAGKRSRSDYDVSGVHDLPNYFPHDDDRGGLRVIRDAESLDASYENYLRSAISSYGSGQSTRTVGERVPNRTIDDSHVANIGGVDRGTNVKDKILGFSSGRVDHSLPPDATSTLFVEGLPSNCTRREVAHIFRPFVGYKEVRLVSKESRQPRGDPMVLCFIDFLSPGHAATAMEALQGYVLGTEEKRARFGFYCLYDMIMICYRLSMEVMVVRTGDDVALRLLPFEFPSV
ncbi:nuclear speckle RNA-binding protein A isoform X2 [Vigna radiata var. radiata]|uniref:Nuclear speckle RNA-binding protein A isoform X2 n=1 Tax=Vigna radiata var. radiata TaxID=3916 RepID=A0A1S3VK64_VIGRR|nr:nuclear speckle RNA-binding protein A isoform X2 [Vigna radiata var. radiata]